MSAATGADESAEAVDMYVTEGPEQAPLPDEPLGDVVFAALRKHAKQAGRSAQVRLD